MKNILFITLSLSILYTVGCTYTIKIKDGKTAYERKQYAVATNFLQKEYGRGKSTIEKGKTAFLLGNHIANCTMMPKRCNGTKRLMTMV